MFRYLSLNGLGRLIDDLKLWVLNQIPRKGSDINADALKCTVTEGTEGGTTLADIVAAYNDGRQIVALVGQDVTGGTVEHDIPLTSITFSDGVATRADFEGFVGTQFKTVARSESSWSTISSENIASADTAVTATTADNGVFVFEGHTTGSGYVAQFNQLLTAHQAGKRLVCYYAAETSTGTSYEARASLSAIRYSGSNISHFCFSRPYPPIVDSTSDTNVGYIETLDLSSGGTWNRYSQRVVSDSSESAINDSLGSNISTTYLANVSQYASSNDPVDATSVREFANIGLTTGSDGRKVATVYYYNKPFPLGTCQRYSSVTYEDGTITGFVNVNSNDPFIIGHVNYSGGHYGLAPVVAANPGYTSRSTLVEVDFDFTVKRANPGIGDSSNIKFSLGTCNTQGTPAPISPTTQFAWGIFSTTTDLADTPDVCGHMHLVGALDPGSEWESQSICICAKTMDTAAVAIHIENVIFHSTASVVVAP